MMDEMITISKKRYEELLSDEKELLYLKGAGVDNWEGYEFAMQMMEENNGN